MFTKVLVANRGEIAVRIMRTLRAMGIASVAVHSRRDARSLHVECADDSVVLPDTDATGGYLDVGAIVAAAQAFGCDAVHPGYGFLSENPALVEACTAADITFIGPSAASMRALGDKDCAREVATMAGVPVVPGVANIDAAALMETPILIKPVAGGGGKGMHVVNDIADLKELAQRAEREAVSAFGDGRLIFERYLPRARHIEVQVAALPDGRVLALGDRECTLQRRHQKVIEEAPAPGIPDLVRANLHAAAVAVIQQVGYRNLATVEFVMSCDDPAEFYFLEVNTRLQVEHPVTEAVTGVDLVELQLLVAAEAPIPASFTESQSGASLAARVLTEGVTPTTCGHAVEARVYAEDPRCGFLPTGGRLIGWHTPTGIGVRVDSGVREGDVIGSGYDPMIAKVIGCGSDRTEALSVLDAALADTVVLGMSTNTGFLRDLLALPEVTAASMDTRLIDRVTSEHGLRGNADNLSHDVAVAWALSLAAESTLVDESAWGAAWRIGSAGSMTIHGSWNLYPVVARVNRRAESYVVDVATQSQEVTHVNVTGDRIHFDCDGAHQRWSYARSRTPDGESTWIGRDGHTWCIDHRRRVRDGATRGTTSPQVRSPMPGTVLQVLAARGDRVTAGQPLVVLEAMKMEHHVGAPHDGTLSEVSCVSGSHVRLHEVLAVVEPHS